MFDRNDRSAPFNPTTLSAQIASQNFMWHVRKISANGMDDEICAKDSTPGPLCNKRPRSSPTLHTPQRELKRTPFRQKMQDENFSRPRVLSQCFVSPKQGPDKQEKWSDDELRALVEFVLFYSDGITWPSHKREEFWNSASEFVLTRAASGVCRSGKHYTISCNCSLIIWFLQARLVDLK